MFQTKIPALFKSSRVFYLVTRTKIETLCCINVYSLYILYYQGYSAKNRCGKANRRQSCNLWSCHAPILIERATVNFLLHLGCFFAIAEVSDTTTSSLRPKWCTMGEVQRNVDFRKRSSAAWLRNQTYCYFTDQIGVGF